MTKNILRGIGVLSVLLALCVAALMVFGTLQLNAGMTLTAEDIVLPTDAASIAEGKRLLAINQCTDCHGENLGGTHFIDSKLFMQLPAPNLTSGAGGLAGRLTPAAWEHAIRHGVGQDGRSLIIMPSSLFAAMTDADVAAIIAYAQQAPPIDTPPPERAYGPIGRLAAAFQADELLHARRIDHRASHRAKLRPGDTAELGSYLGRTCVECHGADFGGGPLPFATNIYASNLTTDTATGLGSWSLADFTRVLREGVPPDGRTLDANMPWQGYSRFTDEEIAALWSHLRALPPVSRAREQS